MKPQIVSSYLYCLLLVLSVKQITVDARIKGEIIGRALSEDEAKAEGGNLKEEKVDVDGDSKEVKVKGVKVKEATLKEDGKEGGGKDKEDGKGGGKSNDALIYVDDVEDREDTPYGFDEDGKPMYIGVVQGEDFDFVDSEAWERLDPKWNSTTPYEGNGTTAAIYVGNGTTMDVLLIDDQGEFIGVGRVGDGETAQTNGQLLVNGTLNITDIPTNLSHVATSNDLEARVLELELQMSAMSQLSEKVWMLELEVGRAKQTITNHERLITSLAMAVAPFTPMTIEEEEPLHVTWLMSKEFSRQGSEP
jgi:hypothetical protein